jgi:O-Antigen ligase
MKWIYLAGLLVLAILLAAQLKRNPRWLPHAAFGLAMMPFLEARFHLTSAPISWAGWAGPVQGIEVSATDAFAFAILLASRSAKSPTMLKIAFAFVAFAYAVSTISTGMHMESFFTGWQILKAVVVYLAVTRACMTNKDTALGLMNGLITGIAIQAVIVSWEIATTGQTQAGGWFGHQNMLGFATHFVVYPALAALMGGYYPKRMLVAVLSGILIAFAGASRATIGLMILGMVLTLIFSSTHKVNSRKMAMAGGALIALLMVSPILYSALQRRTVEQRENSTEVRDNMKAAAALMIADYPLGVGPNRYVLVANLAGYSEKAGVPWNTGNRGAPVHDLYYLMTTEMGWLGLASVIWLFVACFIVAVRAMRRVPAGFGGELAAGIAVTMIIVAVHSNFEWIFMLHANHDFFAMSAGMASAIYMLARRSRGAQSAGSRIAGPQPQFRDHGIEGPVPA